MFFLEPTIQGERCLISVSSGQKLHPLYLSANIFKPRSMKMSSL